MCLLTPGFLRSESGRIIDCYLDTTPLVLQNSENVVVDSTFFLNSAAIVLQASANQ